MTAVHIPELALVRELGGHSAPIRSIAFGGDYTATADAEMNLLVHEHGQVIRRWNLAGKSSRGRAVDRMRGLAFDAWGRILAGAGRYLWCLDVPSGLVVWRYQAPNFLTFLINAPTCVACLEDGSSLASFEDGSVMAFDPYGTRTSSRKDNDAPTWMEALGDGQTVVGADAFSWSVWREGRKLSATKPDGHIYGMAVDAQSGHLALRTSEGIEVWDIASGERLSLHGCEPGLPAIAAERGLVASLGVGRVVVTRAKGEPVAIAPLAASLLLRDRDGSQDEDSLPEHHRPTAVRIGGGQLWVGASNGQVLGYDL